MAGLVRPSTSFLLVSKQDVDARNRRGHDGGGAHGFPGFRQSNPDYGGLLLLNRHAVGAEIDAHALGLLAILIELIAQDEDNDHECADDEVAILLRLTIRSPLLRA